MEIKGLLTPHTEIVNILANRKKEIPIGYLARLLGRRTAEIEAYLKQLEEDGAIEIHDQSVSLTTK
jgi:Mn-dependent DtxR family transcriptional regulator